MDIPKEVEGYFTTEGVLHTWPSAKKASARLGVLARLANEFEPGVEYSEVQVNAMLKELSITGDHALLRRELVDGGFVQRTRDGRKYWRQT